MPRRTLPRLALLAGAALALQPPAHAADPQPYAVAIAPTGDAAIDSALHDSSTLISLQKSAPAGPFALVTRAQDDIGRLKTALRSFGYYDSSVTVRIDGRPLDDVGLTDELAARAAADPAKIDITVARGPLFHLGRVEIAGPISAADRTKLGLKPGDPVIASQVLAAQNTLLSALRDEGHALAKVSDPDAVEHPAEHTIDVTFHADPGPRVDIGDITVNGLKVTNDSYVRRRLLVHEGELYDPRKIDQARSDLLAAGVFSSVDATIPDHLSPNGTIPLTFTVTERLRHTVSFNLAYATDTGAYGGVTFTYRNVFGNGETFTAGAAITQAEQGALIKTPGYNVNVTLTQPDWLQRDQTLTWNAAYLKENLFAYSRKGEQASVTVSRKLSDRWSVSVGLAGENETVNQQFVNTNYELVQVPLGVTYDSTGSGGLFEPTHGIKAKLQLTPSEPFGGRSSYFTLAELSASTYINVGAKEGRSVIALRGTVGSALGASTAGIPPDQRYYAGGSATVRGYRYQSVGPLFPDSRPIGGASLTAATVEFRQRIGESFGAVAFVDAGQVGKSSAPFTGTLFEGVGVGARYFTSIGPIRLDIAVPLEKRRKDDILEAYIGLGEAF